MAVGYRLQRIAGVSELVLVTAVVYLTQDPLILTDLGGAYISGESLKEGSGNAGARPQHLYLQGPQQQQPFGDGQKGARPHSPFVPSERGCLE